MKTTIALTLLLLCVLNILSCQPCSDCCQPSSSCCQPSSSCCQTSSNCCQTSTSCCQTCQIRCRTSSCVDTCKADCCTPKKCPDDSPVEAETPDNKCPDKDKDTELADDKTSEGTKNVNKNDINFTASINLNNVVNNENRVYVPINITNHNSNSVIITSSMGEIVTNTPDHSTPAIPTPRTVVVTVRVPVLIPVPGKNVTIYRPLPYPVPFPVLIPIRGCCVTVTPCVTDYCNPYGRACGDDCTDRFMYRPVNPCENGCFRRFAASRRNCYGSGYCRNDYVDCSYCNEDFYTSYDGYQQCGGCFYPYY